MIIIGDTKDGWVAVREITGTDTPITSIMLDALPEGTKDFTEGEKCILKIGAYSTGADNATATLKFWGFRKNSTLAEYIGQTDIVVGSNALTVSPMGKKVSARFVDTFTVTDKWSTEAGVLFVEGGDSAGNRLGTVLLDLMGCSHLYVECTAGNTLTTLTVFCTTLNS